MQQSDSPKALCIHCEQHPATTELDLCPKCDSVEQHRVLYLRRRGWTPRWEAHLRRLTERAKLRLPLFDDPNEDDIDLD